MGGEAIYANEALYANLGGDLVYANVAEVSNIFLLSWGPASQECHFYLFSYYLQANEAQALLEVPGRSGLAGRTAEAVARGLDRAQAPSRQPLPGLRPLGLRMEVGFSFLWWG